MIERKTKKCSKCNLPKPLKDFSKHGTHAWCKLCANAWSAAYRLKNLDNIRTQQRVSKLEHPSRYLLAYAKARAKRLNVPFALQESDIVIPTNCPILGLKLEPGPLGSQWPASPTLDRVIPELGYVPSNVAVISWRANQLKSDATIDELRQIVEWWQKQPTHSTGTPLYTPPQGHPNRKVLSQDQEKAIAKEYQTGATMAVLAKKSGCVVSTISNTLHRLQVPIRPPVAWRNGNRT